VGTAGDVNGDGYSDVIVGAVYHDNGETNEGSVFVYHGSAGGLGVSAGWTAESNQAGGYFGGSVGTAGDVNGDGYSDVVVGAPNYTNGQTSEGRALVYYGNEGDGLHRIPRQARTDDSAPIALLGRSDSEDGFLLKALGRTPAGRGDVRLQYEVKPAGTAFNGNGLVTGPANDTGVPGVGGSMVALSGLVSGLDAAALYHWRLRVVSDSPFFPRSPWFSLPYNGVTEPDVRTAGITTGVAGARSGSPSLLILGRAAPNPFGSSTTLSYALPEAGHVRLAVYNVAGREVAVVSEGETEAGLHAVRWDGRGVDGRDAPAGVYFARLTFAGREETRKIVLTR
jgi:hypothetical protein